MKIPPLGDLIEQQMEPWQNSFKTALWDHHLVTSCINLNELYGLSSPLGLSIKHWHKVSCVQQGKAWPISRAQKLLVIFYRWKKVAEKFNEPPHWWVKLSLASMTLHAQAPAFPVPCLPSPSQASFWAFPPSSAFSPQGAPSLDHITALSIHWVRAPWFPWAHVPAEHPPPRGPISPSHSTCKKQNSLSISFCRPP